MKDLLAPFERKTINVYTLAYMADVWFGLCNQDWGGDGAQEPGLRISCTSEGVSCLVREYIAHVPSDRT